MIEVIPTVVPGSYEDVAAFVASTRTFARAFHIDVADGTLAPNTTWVPTEGQKFPDAADLFYEAHLMLRHPEATGHAFIAAGAKRIVAHVEAFDSETEASRTFASWRAAGLFEIGAGLLVGTPLEAFEAFSLHCNSVTVMSIASVGVQGIPFDERGYARVADIHARYPDLAIEVDGGVGETQIAALTRAGATRFSVRSAIAKAADPALMHKKLFDLASGAV